MLKRIVGRHCAALSADPQAEWSGFSPADESELPNLDAEPTVAGIYVRLLADNPGWILRKPKEILAELLDAALQGLHKEPDQERTKLIVASICRVLHSQPLLAEHIPSLGPLPRLVRLLTASCDSASAASSVGGLVRLLASVASASTSCVEALARLEVVLPLGSAIRNHPQHSLQALQTLDTMMGQGGAAAADELVGQALSVDLVGQLLAMLKAETPAAAALSSAAKAVIVSILKTMAANRLHGGRVAALLDQCPSWASYKDQRHDLFLQVTSGPLSITSGGAPTATAGVAGYLTQGGRGQAVGVAPCRQAPPPPADPLHAPLDS